MSSSCLEFAEVDSKFEERSEVGETMEAKESFEMTQKQMPAMRMQTVQDRKKKMMNERPDDEVMKEDDGLGPMTG